MQIIHHGGKETVTGSCHELRLGKKGILVDCGLFQGRDSRPMAIDFPLTHLQALLLTHSHIDHIGRIPWLLAAGFHQPIYCTPATAELLPLMLEDGLKLQLGLGQAQRTRILERLNKQIKPVNYGVWQRISRDLDNTYFRFTPAGHILGSAFIEVKLPNNEIVLFSGDLGPSNTPLLPDPVSPPRADYLLIESTYANKTHDNVQLRAQRLKDIINRSLQDGGTILIPAFSVGRTQELLFDIEQLIFSGEIDGNIPIILDSPMAQQVTKSYRKFKKLWGKEAKKRLDAQRHPLAFEQCITVQDYRSHQALVNRLASTGEAAIVVAASGMCEGGRVMAYLKALLPDKRTDVIFAGFQAQGTLGRAIAQGDHSVMIDGDEALVNAQVHSMSGYSAHADQADLLRFIEGIATKPKQIHLIHGEPTTKQAFAATLRSLGYEVID
ncbi:MULTISPECIES: MBL fold metallo-hydrolase RNA specificity domain-containing protein [unclassified Vibrio]|uniref:MBL fold metallo-hydrolase n=1 Tax=Vibrio anguillarum TaxID=55601 RepID=A0AAW4B9B7_VIBAN|nr:MULTISPECIES: MBL fold metallo-hydrolase [unclassified Vibrio]MBF4434690.1 MBL fold metallo-hydrolase [Vibrio anguillarum]NAW92263.1 MBL fold metallo-hydrolase [Vibrio sp. V24_P1S3T111]OXX21158.1 MBL fold hydrolase [Vibrio sp. V05_P4A8T149]OXX24086.1 MBL fold hydrolase [Vibrio sp. V06_P1A73T115]OXX33939.1 MBL fold hydrolase [Vibrio sp. V14_P6S14T42]